MLEVVLRRHLVFSRESHDERQSELQSVHLAALYTQLGQLLPTVARIQHQAKRNKNLKATFFFWTCFSSVQTRKCKEINIRYVSFTFLTMIYTPKLGQHHCQVLTWTPTRASVRATWFLLSCVCGIFHPVHSFWSHKLFTSRPPLSIDKNNNSITLRAVCAQTWGHFLRPHVP